MHDIEQLSGLARACGLRIAVAESLTSGRLAQTIGAGEGAGEWFGGAIVAYLTEVKERVLGIEPGTDPCSASCAEQLARATQELFDADLTVATTGVGGPDAEDGHPAGTVYVGWATRTRVGHRLLALNGDPTQVLDATIDAALRMLVFHALESDVTDRVAQSAG